MKPRIHLSPVQTLLLVGLGNVMVAGSFLLLGLYDKLHIRTILTFHPLASIFLFSLLSFFVAMKSESALKEGIANDLWSSHQIEPLRKLFQSPWWKAVPIGLIIPAVIIMLAAQRHYGMLGWVFLFPSMTASRLVTITRPPRPPKPPVNWHNAAPIHSDHWGHR